MCSWPENRIIEFYKYCSRYRPELDLVLEWRDYKDGVVGRIGAGKSTITQSLLRILEAAEGKILIDGIDIATLGITRLEVETNDNTTGPSIVLWNSRITLDPFDSYSDHKIWESLKHSYLYQFVCGLQKGMWYEITGGENLSVGERQLICLARALLRKIKIVIFGEAAAAVDLEADSMIQGIIKTEFADCTTITIAHRIQTILDCDKVMIIDNGNVVEFDSPSKLLSLAKDACIVG